MAKSEKLSLISNVKCISLHFLDHQENLFYILQIQTVTNYDSKKMQGIEQLTKHIFDSISNINYIFEVFINRMTFS